MNSGGSGTVSAQTSRRTAALLFPEASALTHPILNSPGGWHGDQHPSFTGEMEAQRGEQLAQGCGTGKW